MKFMIYSTLGWIWITCISVKGSGFLLLDACAKNGITCHENADCNVDTGKDPICRCKTMFQGNGTFCEAATCDNGVRCGANAICSIENDVFTCSCQAGYNNYGLSCTEKTCENASPCGPNGICGKTNAGFSCSCPLGFTGSISCNDIDECASSYDNSCHVNAVCHNTAGSYTCECNNLYTGNGTHCEKKTCENSKPCGSYAVCGMTNAGFSCTCIRGYTGSISCTDIDECASPYDNSCHANAVCRNLAGSYTCECNDLFTGNGTHCEKKTCENAKPCGSNAVCGMTDTGFSCTCVRGYTGSISCTDIDECASPYDNSCHANADCRNTAGSYTCECNDLFTGNGTHCEKCMICHTKAYCTLDARGDNSQCRCKDGYGQRKSECIGYCGNTTVGPYQFNEAYAGDVTFSLQKCNNSRAVASIICSSNGDRFAFDYSTFIEVPCNETISFVAETINWQAATNKELELGLSRLTILVSSGANLERTDAKTFIDAVDTSAKSLLNKTEAVTEVTLRQVVVAANFVTESFAVVVKNGLSRQPWRNATLIKQAQVIRRAIQIFSAKIHRSKTLTTVATKNIRAQVHTNLSVSESEYVYMSPNMRVSVPREAVMQARAKGMLQTDPLVFLEYRGKTLFYTEKNVDYVVTVEFGTGVEIANLTERLRYYPNIDQTKLQSQKIPGKAQKRKSRLECNYYVQKNLTFSKIGCCLLRNTTELTCVCNHLTSFAALLEYEIVDEDTTLSVVTIISCILSIVALVVALMLHVTGKERSDKRQISLSINAHICGALLGVYMTFLLGISQTQNERLCLTATVILQYLLLVTWSWTTVFSYTMYKSLARLAADRLDTNFIKKSAMFAYGLPLTEVGITLLTIFKEGTAKSTDPYCDADGNIPDPTGRTMQGYRAHNMCWLTGDYLKFGYVLPAGIMLLGNYVVFSFLVYFLAKKRLKMHNATSRKNATREVVASASMATSLGLTWIFGYLMLISTDLVYRGIMAWMFTITNALQGLLLFAFTMHRRATLREEIFISVRSRISTFSSGVSTKMRSVKYMKRYIVNNYSREDDTVTNSSESDNTISLKDDGILTSTSKCDSIQ